MDNAEFNAQIDALWTQTKAGLLPREARIKDIEQITEKYTLDDRQIEKLADLILYEELYDTHPDKMTREEYPILSDTQLARRQEGKHVRRRDKDGKLRPNKTEIPLKAAYDYGTDGRDYRLPKRRRLSTDEALISDNKRIINEGRRKMYEEFIKPGKVEVYYIGDTNNVT